MRVLVVHHYPAYGGPYNELIEMQEHMLSAGVETIAVIPTERGTGSERLNGRLSVRPTPLHRARLTKNPLTNAVSLLGFPGDIVRLRRLMRELRPDLVKVYGPQNPQAAIAARLEKVPLVWVISSTRVPPAFRPFGTLLLRSWADAVLTNGRALVRAYPGLEKSGAGIFPYYPPVNTKRFRLFSTVEKERARARFGIEPDRLVVGTVANINPQKGIETFLRGAAFIAPQLPKAVFVVVGGVAPTQQNYFKHMTGLAEHLGLGPDRLKFTGEQDDVEVALNTFDIKLITSIPMSEGTTTTGIEAMACGVPVVAADVGAVSEIIEDGVTGFLVPPLHPASVASRSMTLLRDSNLRQRIGNAGRKRAVGQFDSSFSASAHVQAYRHAIQAAARRQPRHSLPDAVPISGPDQ